jgi:hypothetical protein
MIRIKALKFFRVFVPVNVFLYLAVMAFGPSLLAHQMSPEVFAELREKVLLYREYTDEEIMGSMSRMGPNFRVYLSEADLVGDIGVLAGER